MYPNTNVYSRVLLISNEHWSGTAFVADLDGRQYIITAKHVLGDDPLQTGETREVGLYHNGGWVRFEAILIPCEQEVDIVVLAAPKLLVESVGTLPLGDAGVQFGQDAYFLGFPDSRFDFDGAELLGGRPLAFVKKAIVSASRTQNGVTRWFFDGHNNVGFSGGPIVFEHAHSRRLHVAAVVSFHETEPVYSPDARPIRRLGANSGIFVGFSARHAIAAIKAHPWGRVIPAKSGQPQTE